MLIVSAATETERIEALSLLFEHLPPEEQARQLDLAQSLATEGHLAWDGLLIARENGVVIGVCLTAAQADGSLGVWIPVISQKARPTSHRGAEVFDALLDEVGKRQDRAKVSYAQCLLEEADAALERRLEKAGFERMAELSFMQRELSEPLPAVNETAFSTETYRSEVNESRFADLVERSYRQSLDCPAFTGLRTGQEALESHRATGVFHPDLWHLFSRDGQDVGVLLCADHPDIDAWELAYMGVVPEGRGDGLGMHMVTFALQAASRAGRARMQLAVDSVNGYARKIYEKCGFVEQCRRIVFLRRCFPDHQQVINGS